MGRVNVRVEARDVHPNASKDERDRNFRNLMSSFRQACNKAGIMKEIKRLEFYETPSQLRRKKEREKETNLLKLKMNESFIEKPKAVKKKKPTNRPTGNRGNS
jgi:ribosomal protein S21